MTVCACLPTADARAPEPQFRGEFGRSGADAPAAAPRTGQEQQAEHLYRVGRRYIEQGFYGEGLEALNQSLALRPNYAKALTYKGIALRSLREPALALQQFDEALAAEPDDGVALGERGMTYIVLGERDKAADDLRRSSRLRPDLVPWFTQHSRWLEANRRNMVREPAVPAPSELPTAAPTPAPVNEAGDLPPGGSPAGDDEAADGNSSTRGPLFDLDGAWSLVKPGLFVALSFLALIVGLRIALSIARRLWRRAPLPWQSRLRTQPAADFRPAFGETSESEANVMRPSFRRRHRGLLITIAVGLGVILLFALPVLVQAFRLDADKLTAPRVRPSVLDLRGNVYTHLGVPDTPITYEELPKHLVDALRAREDSRFFEHRGVDWYGLARALVADLRHMKIKQGASTLTMQLVEKVYQLDQSGVVNRVRSKLVEWTMSLRGEAALARKLGDRRAAKQAIMTAYLNRVEFGGGTVGVGAAAEYYFNKPVSKLKLGESCMLVALLRAPTANSPYRNPENSRLARDAIVAQMLRRGFITDAEAQQARFLVVKNPRKPKPKHNGYLVAALTREMNALKADGKLPADLWDHESLVITSTLDLWAQDILDSEIRKVIASYKGDTESDPLLGTAMILDNATGQIRALVAGQDYSKSQYDLAFSSRRQVASIAKPFVYGAYLERGGDIAEVLPNSPLTAEEVHALKDWNPRNSSALKSGNHTLSSGLAFSDNTMTVRVGLKAGLQSAYNALNSAGLISDKTTTGPTWLLGTFESSLAQVVSAYTAFPRGGTRATPYLVQRVEIEGKEVYRGAPKSTKLFAPRTSQQLHQALRQAMTEGTGRSAVKNSGLDTLVAGKTGTSQNAADVWWVGYVKELTLGIRFGRNSNTPLGNAAEGGTMAAPAAARVLKKLSERYTLQDAAVK